jgi:hypothetical protein
LRLFSEISKISEILKNTLKTPSKIFKKSQKISENLRKSQKISENLRKSQKILNFPLSIDTLNQVLYIFLICFKNQKVLKLYILSKLAILKIFREFDLRHKNCVFLKFLFFIKIPRILKTFSNIFKHFQTFSKSTK